MIFALIPPPILTGPQDLKYCFSIFISFILNQFENNKVLDTKTPWSYHTVAQMCAAPCHSSHPPPKITLPSPWFVVAVSSKVVKMFFLYFILTFKNIYWNFPERALKMAAESAVSGRLSNCSLALFLIASSTVHSEGFCLCCLFRVYIWPVHCLSATINTSQNGTLFVGQLIHS